MATIEETAMAWVARERARGLDAAQRASRAAWLAADPRHHGAWARALAIDNAINLATAAAAGAPLPAATPRRQWLRYGVAACVAATAGTAAWTAWQHDAVLATAKGEFRKVPLRDQSIAEINSGSRIEVKFTEQQRRVTLRQGEAWFEVAKDQRKPFIVESGDARIRAVGTAFSVRRYASGTEVLVTEGTVQVWSGPQRDPQQPAGARMLTAGERAFLPHQAGAIAIVRQPGEVRRRLAWREGKLILKNQTLGEAVADFNRYSPRAIVIVDARLASKRLVGQYQLDAPELFASDVSTVLDVPLSITAETIYIGRAAGSAPRRL